MLCDNMQQRSKQTAAKHTLSWSTIAVFPFESFSLIFVLGRVRMMGIWVFTASVQKVQSLKSQLFSSFYCLPLVDFVVRRVPNMEAALGT